MKTNALTPKIIVVSLFVIAILCSGMLFAGKMKANKNLKQEKIKNETLLSEKILLEEKLASMKNQLNAFAGKNAELDKTLKTKNESPLEKDTKIKSLTFQNQSLISLKKANAELEAARNKLEKEYRELTAVYKQAQDENSRLNELLTSTQNENELLGLNIAVLKAMAADNYRVEATKGKHEKLTVQARRTDKLKVSFDMPAEISSGLTFIIVDPKGTEVSSVNNPDISYRSTLKSDNLLASSSNYNASSALSRNELTYNPDQKLAKGVYNIKIFHGQDYVGSTQLRLK